MTIKTTLFNKKIKQLILLIIVVCIGVLNTMAQTQNTIQFIHKVGVDTLQLQQEYTNSFDEKFSINRFKYYVSNIQINNQNVNEFVNKYYLIDEADSSTKTISFSTHFNEITSISFVLGVDSIKNVSGVQTGVLDPINGMFWTWNSGYIMAKLEGVSTSAKVAGNLFSHHVGGYKWNENTVRKITLSIPKINQQKQQNLAINVDVLKWFQSAHSIQISSHPICHSTGNLAMQIADNYATMFSISTP